MPLKPTIFRSSRPPISPCSIGYLNATSRYKKSHLDWNVARAPLPGTKVISRSFATDRKSVNHGSLSPQPRRPALNADRGPASKEDTQTDFGVMNVLGNTPTPTSSIDACLSDGFHFGNGMKISGGSGCLILAGEVLTWRPWDVKEIRSHSSSRLLNDKGQWQVEPETLVSLEYIQPKPDLLILGLGPSLAPLSPSTRQYLNSLGIRVDIQDTRNAAAQFNMLATERGIGEIAAALIPLG